MSEEQEAALPQAALVVDPTELPPPDISARSMLLGNGPRLARDGAGPMLAFYLGWKASGLLAGIAAATVFSVVAWRYERRQDRSGLMARISLAIVLVQAVVGIISDSASVYLGQQVLVTAIYGSAFLVSAAIGRPLAGSFAAEFYPFPPEVRDSATFRTVFGRVSAAWGAYLIARSALALLVLSAWSVEGFLLVRTVTGVPLQALLMSWSFWYGLRGFRRSEEWGWAFDAPPLAEPGAAAAATG